MLLNLQWIQIPSKTAIHAMKTHIQIAISTPRASLPFLFIDSITAWMIIVIRKLWNYPTTEHAPELFEALTGKVRWAANSKVTGIAGNTEAPARAAVRDVIMNEWN